MEAVNFYSILENCEIKQEVESENENDDAVEDQDQKQSIELFPSNGYFCEVKEEKCYDFKEEEEEVPFYETCVPYADCVSNVEEKFEQIPVEDEPILQSDSQIENDDSISSELENLDEMPQFQLEDESNSQIRNKDYMCNEPNHSEETPQLPLKDKLIPLSKSHIKNKPRNSRGRCRTIFGSLLTFVGRDSKEKSAAKEVDNHLEKNAEHSENKASDEHGWWRTDRRYYECAHCTCKYARKKTLIEHMRKHFNNLPYKCKFCHTCYSEKQTLLRHEKKHSMERPYKCTKCNVRFCEEAYLLSHMKVVHSTKRPYVCEICKADFKYKSVLKGHMKVHLDDKLQVQRSFNCEICSKSFFKNSQLTNHARAHAYQQYSFSMFKNARKY